MTDQEKLETLRTFISAVLKKKLKFRDELYQDAEKLKEMQEMLKIPGLEMNRIEWCEDKILELERDMFFKSEIINIPDETFIYALCKGFINVFSRLKVPEELQKTSPVMFFPNKDYAVEEVKNFLATLKPQKDNKFIDISELIIEYIFSGENKNAVELYFSYIKYKIF